MKAVICVGDMEIPILFANRVSGDAFSAACLEVGTWETFLLRKNRGRKRSRIEMKPFGPGSSGICRNFSLGTILIPSLPFLVSVSLRIQKLK
jgi:hypothetical protein